jgi:hypothetical protein
MMINELRKYKIAIAAIQETRWTKSTPQAFASNGYNIYNSSLTNKHEFGTALSTDILFALRQILEKGNEYNIQTHHLFIDIKAAYDTIT